MLWFPGEDLECCFIHSDDKWLLLINRLMKKYYMTICLWTESPRLSLIVLQASSSSKLRLHLMCLTNQLSLKCSECEDLGTEIFTFTLLAISLVTRFTGADERPLSVFTQQISVTVMGITCALVYIWKKGIKKRNAIYVSVIFFSLYVTKESDDWYEYCSFLKLLKNKKDECVRPP